MNNTISIDLWFWTFDQPDDRVQRWRGMLDDDECRRVDKFLFERDQKRFTVCRSRMRRILAWYTRRRAHDVAFKMIGREKPALADGQDDGLVFNLSHTDGLACLAVTRHETVGVDLEMMRPIEDDFIRFALTGAESECVLAQPPSERRAAFFRHWTAKEAYLKAIGTGLWQSLKTFDVSVPIDGNFVEGQMTRIEDAAERERSWRLFSFVVGDTYIGALALPAPAGARIDIRRVSIDGAGLR